MAFEIHIQRTLSEPIRIIKEVNDMLVLTGTLRDGSSIVDPVVLIESNDLSILAVANYFTIPSFGRSYFISDISSIRAGLVQISGHVDVLSSFGGDIQMNKGIVFRQENDWNLYLNDGVLEIYQNPIVVTKEFPYGFTGDERGGQSYVLALGGRRGRVTTVSSAGATVINGGGTVIGSGAGDVGTGNGSKTCSGLAAYALGHLNCPYWWGTFGNIADANLYNYKRYSQYPAWYEAQETAGRNFSLDYGSQVFDCVGLVKGYRWSTSMTGSPTYVAAEDWDVKGMFSHCSGLWGTIGDTEWVSTYSLYPGVLVFMGDLSHVGVSMGDGTVTHCTSGTYNKVINTPMTGWSWQYYGIPDWLRIAGQNSAI